MTITNVEFDNIRLITVNRPHIHIMNFSKKINYICIAAALGGLLFGFDTAVISGAISFVKINFSLDATMEGWLVSSGLLGCIIGVLQRVLLSDRIGRKKTIIIAGIMFLSQALVARFASSFNYWSLPVLSEVLGLGWLQ